MLKLIFMQVFYLHYFNLYTVMMVIAFTMVIAVMMFIAFMMVIAFSRASCPAPVFYSV